MSEFVSIAEGIAREAGALLRDYYHRGVTAEFKGDVDIVTEADRFAATAPQHDDMTLLLMKLEHAPRLASA